MGIPNEGRCATCEDPIPKGVHRARTALDTDPPTLIAFCSKECEDDYDRAQKREAKRGKAKA